MKELLFKQEKEKKEREEREARGENVIPDASPDEQNNATQPSLETPADDNTNSSSSSSSSTSQERASLVHLTRRLPDLIEAHFSPEVIEVTCPTCGGKFAESTSSISALPETIIIQLTRTVLHNYQPRKLEVPIVSPIEDYSISISAADDDVEVGDWMTRMKETEAAAQHSSSSDGTDTPASLSCTTTQMHPTEEYPKKVLIRHTDESGRLLDLTPFTTLARFGAEAVNAEATTDSSSDATPAQEPVDADGLTESEATIVASLCSMDFSRPRCIRALRKTKETTASGSLLTVDSVLEVLFQTMDNPALDLSLESTSAAQDKSTGEIPTQVISSIMEMGFSHTQAVNAAKHAGQDVDECIAWILAHLDESEVLPAVDAEIDAALSSAQSPTQEKSACSSAPPSSHTHPDYTQLTQQHSAAEKSHYRLFAFINHKGLSVQSGHYVCFIRRPDYDTAASLQSGSSSETADAKKDPSTEPGKWIVFNDEKVSFAKEVPLDQAYILFYRRV